MASRVPALLRAFLAAAFLHLVGCGPHEVEPSLSPPTGDRAAAGTVSGPVWDQASPDPDRIILTWSDDPATTQSVTWRTDASVEDGWGEIALATESPRFSDSARLVPARTQTLDIRQVPRAGVKVNYHSLTFTGLDTERSTPTGSGMENAGARGSSSARRANPRDPSPFSTSGTSRMTSSAPGPGRRGRPLPGPPRPASWFLPVTW